MGKQHEFKPDIEAEEFRRAGYRVIDIITEYYQTIRDRKITSENDAGTISAIFDEPLPLEGNSPDAIIRDWEEKVIPNATHLGSPRYFGFVNGSGTMISVFADALATSINMNAGGWKAGPAATEIEGRCISWIAEMIGYPVDCGGLFLGGGTIANFAALLTAFRNKADYDSTTEGLQSGQSRGRYTIYMSDHEGHISIVKAADMLNLGRNCIRRVPSNADFTLNTEALAAMIDDDARSGMIPFCVVAQVGAINTGAIDPLEKIAEICREKDLWFHADGACGAVGAMLPEKAALYKGMEKADSVTLDPHKWLFIPYECGCLLVREGERLRRTFSTSAPYLQGTLPTDHSGLNYFDYGPQMSRGFDAAKVWMTLKHFGLEGYRQLLRKGIACAVKLDELVRASEDFAALHKPELFIYSFQFAPKEFRDKNRDETTNARLDRANQQLADRITESGFAFIMTTRIHGRVVLRLSICSHRTTLDDIEAVFRKLESLGEALKADPVLGLK